MKESSMRRIAKTRTARTKRLKEGYADSHGIMFHEYRLWLPELASDWPSVRRVDSPHVLGCISRLECWACRYISFTNPCDLHHLVGGTKGRSDERCNLMPLCRECHDKANTKELPLGRLMWLLWVHDRWGTDWVRLALLKRSHLPDLITD
jgi:5-methylcytosine-specific restriction endonuclease McrA